MGEHGYFFQNVLGKVRDFFSVAHGFTPFTLMRLKLVKALKVVLYLASIHVV
jgi:hypothetical protein